MRRYGLVDVPDEPSDIGAIPVSSDSIISGGIVTWSGTGLVFNVSACNYYIDGVNYNSPDSTLTLAAADPTDDRIDVFAVDINGDAIVITGTPAANPQEPQVDPATQIKLTTVIVAAGATTPQGVTNNMIYDENVEAWSKTSNSLTVDYVNTTTPYVGTYCILATTTAAATFKALTFYKASTYANKADYDIFSFAIKLTQALLSTESIKIIFSNSSLYPNIKVAEYSITSNNSLGLSFANTSGYQLIGIPMNNINFTNNSFNYVQIQFITARTGISFRLDRILLQYGINQPSSPTDKNSFGNVVSQSGTASATMATDTLTINGSGLATTSISGKTLTIAVPTPIPTQTGNNGKYLKTDGSALSWDFPLNIYNSNGSLSSDRTLTASTYSLTMSGTKTSGASFYFQNSQSGTNASDSGDGTLSINYNINGSSGTELVVRAVAMGVDNNMTGGTVTNMRAWNLAYTTASGSTTSNLDLIYLESVSSAGTVTDVRGVRINILQGTNQAGLAFNALGGTNNAYAIFGQTAIPTGSWGIYQSESGYTNYFAGKILIGTTTIGTESLSVVGSAIISSTITLSSLAGTGTRMVVADGSGVLSTQAIPGGGGGMAIGGSITSATAGSVLFAGTSGVLAKDNANFFWDDTNNRLGIGTASPSEDLHILKSTLSTALIESTTNSSTASLSIKTGSIGALFRAYGSSFTIASLANKAGFGPDGATGLVIFTNSTVVSGGSGSLSIRGGGYDTGAEILLIDKDGSTFSKTATLSNNQNAATIWKVSNTTSGTASQSTLQLFSDVSSGNAAFGKYSTSTTTYKIVNAKDAFFYNATGGDISILNDFATGKIKFAGGAVSTAQMTLTSAGRLLIGTTTESTFLLDVNGTARVSGKITANGSTTSTSGLDIGTLRFQYFATNNSFIAENTFYNGTAFQRINTGLASVFYLSSGGFQIGTLTSAAGGTTQTLLNNRMQLSNDGKLQISDLISGGGPLTHNASAVLQADSTTKGFLPPRMTTTQRNAIASPATGLMIYNTSLNTHNYYNGTAWVEMLPSTFYDGLNIVLADTTGTKLGTAITQKLGFWNTTPVVQPDTTISPTAMTANSGTNINVSSTFAGYTVGQVVAALRLIGILA